MLISFQRRNEALPESTFGRISLQSRTIVINTVYARTKSAKYYIAMLEDTAQQGYDCTVKIIGGEAVRYLSMPPKR